MDTFLIGDSKILHPSSILEPKDNVYVSQDERNYILDNFYIYRTSNMVTNETLENFEGSTNEVLDNVLMYQINTVTQDLAGKELDVIVKTNAIQDVQNDTNKLYKHIYVIIMGILVVVVLGVVTFMKPFMTDKVYKYIIMIVLLSYFFYILYLYNIMYVQDGINKIITFLQTGKIDISAEIDLNKVPKNVYLQQLCQKKRSLEDSQSSDENNDSQSSTLDSMDSSRAKELLDKIGPNDKYFYNDNNAPKQQLYPTKFDDKKDGQEYIYKTDYDSVMKQDGGELVRTSQL